jgi:hypothetical protein
MTVEQKVYISRHGYGQRYRLKPKYTISWVDIITYCRLIKEISSHTTRANWLLSARHRNKPNLIDEMFTILFFEYEPYRKYILSILRPHVIVGEYLIDVHEYWRKADRSARHGYHRGSAAIHCIWNMIELITADDEYVTLVNDLCYLINGNNILYKMKMLTEWQNVAMQEI